jgi:hypothetical protein
MKIIVMILFLPFRVLAGNQVSGILFNIFKKYPWLNIILSFLFALVTILIVNRG